MPLKFRPKSEQVRMVFTSGDAVSKPEIVRDNPDKIFAIIGPFSSHTACIELQKALVMLLRGYNTKAE